MTRRDHSATNWHRTPSALATLTRLSPDDIIVRLVKPVVGPEYLGLLPDEDTQDALYDLRKAAVEATFGMTFSEAGKVGRTYDYLECSLTAPSIEDVLAERFGDPRKFGNTDAHTATLLWRAEAKAASQIERAA